MVGIVGQESTESFFARGRDSGQESWNEKSHGGWTGRFALGKRVTARQQLYPDTFSDADRQGVACANGVDAGVT